MPREDTSVNTSREPGEPMLADEVLADINEVLYAYMNGGGTDPAIDVLERVRKLVNQEVVEDYE